MKEQQRLIQEATDNAKETLRLSTESRDINRRRLSNEKHRLVVQYATLAANALVMVLLVWKLVAQ